MAASARFLQAEGLQLHVEPADLTDSVAAQVVMERIEDDHGPIDILVNCAGAADAQALHAAMQAKYFAYMHAIAR